MFVQGWPIYALAASPVGSFGWLQFFLRYQAGIFFYFFFYKQDDWQSSTRWWYSSHCQEWKSCLWFTATYYLINILMHIIIAKGYHILNFNPCLCVPGAGYFSYSIFADWKAARTVTSLTSAVSFFFIPQSQGLCDLDQTFIIFCFHQSSLFWIYTEIMRSYKTYFWPLKGLIS